MKSVPSVDNTEKHLFEAGLRYLERGCWDMAIVRFKRLLMHNPELAEVHYNIGVAHHKSGRLKEAVAAYQQALKLAPPMIQAHYNRGVALQELNDHDASCKAYQQVLLLDPDHAAAAYNLGNLYKSKGQYDQAVSAYQKALAARPQYAEALNNIGVIRRDLDQLEEAVDYFRQALCIKPQMPEALYNLGIVLQKQGQYSEGRNFFRRALEADPEYGPARWLFHLSLPMLYESEDEVWNYRLQFTRNLEKLIDTTSLESVSQKRSALQGVGSTTNFYLQYQGLNDVDLQKRYGQFAARIMAASYPQWASSRSMTMPPMGKKIRLGYVSSFMRSHTIGVYLLGWLENHDRSAFELYCYHLGEQTDGLTERFAQIADYFHQFGGNIEAAANQIDGDRLHILVHSDVGMNPVTLQLAALRLAPLQFKGWGHPATTGLPAIDYYLSSDLMEPANGQQAYSEKLIRLPNLALCYQPPALPANPKSRSELGLPSEGFIYLSSQSLFKYLPQHDFIYPTIASQVPDARFVFIAHASTLVTQKFKERLNRSFAQLELDADRYCIFSPKLVHADFLSINLAADVLLDTLSWSGGKTTLEAIACGLPVVTCPGAMMRGRHAYAMLAMMGLDQTVARDETHYCEIAVRLARESSFYRQMKREIIKRAPRLYGDRDCISALEEYYCRACSEYGAREQVRQTSLDKQQMPAESADAFDRLYERARALHDQGRQAEAIPLYIRALAIQPDLAEGFFNLGVAHHELQQLRQAINAYQKALTLQPDWPDAMFNLAKALEATGQPQQAEDVYRKLVLADRDNAKAAYNLATLFLEQQRYTEAVPAFRQAVAAAPRMAAAYNNLGKALQATGKFEEALSCFQTACDIDPQMAQAWFNLADTQQSMGELEAAVENYQKAIAQRADMGEAYNNMGNAYRELKDFGQAARCYRQVLALNPDQCEAHYNLGSVLRMGESYADALAHLSRAIQLRPGYAEAWNNLALTCKNIGELDRALTCFERAIQLAPDLAVAHWNRSFVYLLKEDYSRGWVDFEWRFQIPQWKSIYPFRLQGERWDGQPVSGKTILVHDEQGLGDTFQFVRYLPQVKALNNRVILETRAELVSLLQVVDGIDEIVVRPHPGQPHAPHDLFVPLMSLPGIFNTTFGHIPCQLPYITVDSNKRQQWKSRMPVAGPRVGLVWAGRPQHTNDHNRSCRLEDLLPILTLKGLQLVALQKGPAARQADELPEELAPPNLGPDLHDFSDTAAVLANLDLLITVDTAVAHLAGAMGIPVWVLIPFIPDWRWAMYRSTTPWYPTMHLYRQSRPKDWSSAVKMVRDDLMRGMLKTAV